MNSLDVITNISSFEMNTKIRTHEIRDDKKKFHIKEESNLKDRPQSNPLLPKIYQEGNELSSPTSPVISERNVSTEIPSLNGESENKFRISIDPQPPEITDSEKDKNKPKINVCECEHGKKPDFPNDDVANHVKFNSFDIIRLVGKGSFGQVFLVNFLKILSFFDDFCFEFSIFIYFFLYYF